MTGRDAPAAHVERAPAKVNLGLEVLAKRGDGFHEVDTVFVTTSVEDEVRLWVEEGVPPPEVRGHWRLPEPVPGASEGPMAAHDLALRAAGAYLHAAGRAARVEIEVTKRIPVSAGLGGGSSDAGAVLRALARLLPARVDLHALAARLGSDVPFFARGHAAARGRGRGERLTPLEVPELTLVLLHTGAAVRSGEAFAALTGFGAPVDPTELQRRLRDGDPPGWRNGLQAGVARAHPEVREALAALRQVGLRSPLLSGSGGACFALATDASDAETRAEALRDRLPGAWVRVARAPAP